VLLQAVSIAGALLILAAYAAHQAGRMSRDTAAYHAINAVGGALLLLVAWAAWQIGFILLEGAWMILSLLALARVRGRRAASQPRKPATGVLE
jgi:uncharacterized membrane protein